MKLLRYLSIAGLGLVLTSFSTYAVIPANGWYAGLFAGVSYKPGVRPRFITTNPLNGFPIYNYNGSLSYNGGGIGGGQIGYRLCNFRLEGELAYNYSPYQKLQYNNITIKRHYSTLYAPIVPILNNKYYIDNVRLSGHTSFGAGFINLYYDIFDEDDDPTWIPYLGLGVGYATLQNSLTIETLSTATAPVLPSTQTNHIFKTNTNSVIGQAIIGLSYYYSDELFFGLDYRYLSTNTIPKFQTRAQVHTLNLGFNYTFYEI